MCGSSERPGATLFDSDVVIWALRAHAGALHVLEGQDDRKLALASYLEILQGARNRAEQRLIQSFLRDHDFQTLPLTQAIGHRAAVYMEEFGLSSALSAMDALIAASAVESGEVLCTGNRKHFAMIPDLELKLFRP